jgi:two-component system, response regulator PdtaR
MAKTRIMIVEDEIIIAMALSKDLEVLGYEICGPVCSGEQAIEKTEPDKPDVVLMDINIRGEISGIEAAREIRSRFGVPIVFMTGYSDQDMAERAKLLKPIGYFVKPVRAEELQLTIDSALNKPDEDLK